MLGARRGSSGVKTDSGRKWKKSGRPPRFDQEATLEPHTEHQVWSCSVFQKIPRQREEKKIKVNVGGVEFTLIKGHLKTHCNPDKPQMLGRSLLSSVYDRVSERGRATDKKWASGCQGLPGVRMFYSLLGAHGPMHLKQVRGVQRKDISYVSGEGQVNPDFLRYSW